MNSRRFGQDVHAFRPLCKMVREHLKFCPKATQAEVTSLQAFSFMFFGFFFVFFSLAFFFSLFFRHVSPGGICCERSTCTDLGVHKSNKGSEVWYRVWVLLSACRPTNSVSVSGFQILKLILSKASERRQKLYFFSSHTYIICMYMLYTSRLCTKHTHSGINWLMELSKITMNKAGTKLSY